MLSSGLIAGAAAGLIAAVLQLSFVQPVLLHAELYEQGELVHVPAEGGHDHDHGEGDAGHAADGHSHDAAAAPEAAATPSHGGGFAIDPARDGLSVAFTIMVYCGWGLLLAAMFSLAEGAGHRISVRSGMIWGIAGFVAVQLAPAFGLAPELPGMAAAEIGGRVAWWLATVVLTVGGLWLIAFGKGWPQWAVAVVLLLAPHVFGAPHPEVLTGPTPPELAAQFAGRALGVGLAAWVLLGLVAARLWTRGQPASA